LFGGSEVGYKRVIGAVKIDVLGEEWSLIDEVIIPVMRKGWGLTFWKFIA
jgi:hypothetical protein